MLKQEKLLKFYQEMKRIRIFEENVKNLFKEGKIHGTVHLYIGEESIAVGVCANLLDKDYIISTHRGHGHCLAKGADPKKMMAEILGKETGYSYGKGGSMHIADVNSGILGANGIVGAGLPISLGSSLASKIRKENNVTVCFFGDGAANNGVFHESLNLASLWKLPILFVCENNQYAVSTNVKNSSSTNTIAERGSAYNIPGILIDGNNVLDVYNQTKDFVEDIRNGKGPILVECLTYRTEGHYVGDSADYRSKEEEKKWKQKDPIKNFTEYLIENNIIEKKDLEKIDKNISEEIKEAVRFAIDSPEPKMNYLYNHVY